MPRTELPRVERGKPKKVIKMNGNLVYVYSPHYIFISPIRVGLTPSGLDYKQQGFEQLKMGHQKKEDEKTERVIRGLLKLPENRRCINCNSLGPQYVCTTFSTFVCTSCSGIHREFTHRIKSMSMAKFTTEEVTALQAGGNERAKQIYLKEWDSLRHSYPDSGNMHRLRDFIKHVYVDRNFTGEKSQGNLPKIRLEESYGSKKSSSFRLDFKSPQSSPGARSDDSSFRYVYDESRSPKYVQKFSRHGGYSRCPIKFEVVDDRFRDDEYRNRRQSNLETKLRQLSIEGPKNVDRLQALVARPLGEIMRENASSLQVTTSGGEGSIDENPSKQTSNNPGKSIDLSTKSQASNAAARVGQETPHMTQPSENNWASFEASTKNNVPITPNTITLKSSTIEETPEAKFANSIDLLLFELSGPLIPTTSGMSEVPVGDNVPTSTTEEKANTLDFPPISMEQKNASPFELEQPSNAAPPAQAELNVTEESIEDSHSHEPTSMQCPPSVSVGCGLTTQPTNAPINDVASNNESSVSPNTHDTSHGFTEQFSQTILNPTQDIRTDVGSQPSVVETRFSGRKELPEDLFTASYFSGGPVAHGGWQNVQHHVMGYGMQYYPNAVPPSVVQIAPRSMNPFEVTEGRSLMHASSFPSMAPLHGVLPEVSPRTGLMHASSLGSLDTMMPQSTSYASQVPSRPPFASGVTTGVCFDQVNHEEQPTRSQRVDPYNGDLTGFGSIDIIQQSCGGYGTPGTPNSFSNTRGNPFD